MAYLVLVINTSDSITELNSQLQSHPPFEGAESLKQYIQKGLAGCVDISIQSTTRDTDPSVSTSGTGSTQVTYSLK